MTVKLKLVKCFPLYSALNVWTHFFPWWRHQIEMETFSTLLALCRRSPVNSPHKGQWRGALICSLICAWRNGLVNNQYAGDLRRHYVVTVMHTAEGTPLPKLNNRYACFLYYCYWLMPSYVKTILKMRAYDIFLCIIMVQFTIKRPDIMYYHSVHIRIYVYYYNGWCRIEIAQYVCKGVLTALFSVL